MKKLNGNGRIAFSRVTGKGKGNIELFSMLANGQDLRQLTFSDSLNYSIPVFNAHPYFSADGKYITFTSNRTGNANIFIMNSDGTGIKQVTSGIGQSEVPSFSPDGTKIAFSGSRNGSTFEIFTISVNGTSENQLSCTNSTNDGPKYTPDGKHIIFSSDMNGTGYPRNRDIYVMDAQNGQNLRRITFGMDNRFARSISPDGKVIVFSSTKNNVGNLYVVNFDGKGLKKITSSTGNGSGYSPLPGWPVFNGAITPVWSPDGKYIAYADNSNGIYNIYVLDRRRERIEQLTHYWNDLSIGWQSISKK